MSASSDALMSPMQAVASTSLLVALWSTTHVYKGITGDAELYAQGFKDGLAAARDIRALPDPHRAAIAPALARWARRGAGPG